MAEALFRQWFIEEAQDDWEEVELDKHLEFGAGFPFKSETYLEQGKFRIATIKHVQDGFLDVSDAPFLDCLPKKIKSHCILNRGDVLLSLTGNVGRCCIVDKENVLLNQRVASILPKDGAQLPFWYFFFRYPETKGILDQLSHGTAQKNLSTRVLGSEKIQLPPAEEIHTRVPKFKAVFDKIFGNHLHIYILESQHEILLPKLMSGEVRVNLG
jgi:type I restriction enzyme S subunit